MTKTLVATPDPEGNSDDWDAWFRELDIDPELKHALEDLEKDLFDADNGNA